MYIGLTPELTELRDELRDYYTKLLTPEVEAELSTGEGIGPVPRKIWKQMAADGWAGIGWPTEYGGQGRTAIEQFIFFDESMRVGAPVPMLTINSVAPTIMRYGSQEQKDFFLPKILAGEIHFAIGYTEPDAGTDLASLKTKAERDGDEYVINGQKVFTSLATDADYIWLAVRTDPNVKKHKGISIIIVPTDSPGFKAEPIKNMGGLDTNVTYYEDLRVPVGNLVGEENQGWNLITNQLNHERGHALLERRGGAPARGHDRVGGGHQAGRRHARDRPGVGADQPGPGARQARVPEARELQGRGRRDPGRAAEPGRRVDDQGLRHRVLPRGVPAPHGDRRPVGAGEVRLAGGGAQGPARGAHAQHAHPHLRRRHQRDAARPDRDLRPQHARLTPVGRQRTVDFTLSEEQQELQGLAKQILGDRMTLTHLRELDNSEDWFDRETWAEFAKANLLGMALPESVGGLGYGFLELCLVLQEQGRTVAPLPLIHTLVSAALPIAEFGTPGADRGAQRRRQWRHGAHRGAQRARHARRTSRRRSPRRSGDGWKITGEKVNVPQAHISAGILVPARVGEDIGLFLVWPKAEGITLERQETMNHEPQFVVKLDGVGGERRGAHRRDRRRPREPALDPRPHHDGISAIAAGACQEALRITAEYTTTRKQFDRAIGTFQAVGQRMADSYIDTEAIHLTMLQAATHLAEGQASQTEVATAKYWAAEGGSRVVHAALHVHGGISIDLDYPIHRYFLWVKQAEFTLGAATPSLRDLGRLIAASA